MPTATCRACGKPMKNKSDFPRGNFSSEYCADCVDARGVLMPRDAIRQNMIRFQMKHNGLSEEEAIEIVDNLMQSLPAWNRNRVTR